MRGAQWWRDSPKTSSYPDRFYNTGLLLRGRERRRGRRRRRRSALRAKATVPRKRRGRPTDTSFLGRPWTERKSQKPRRPPSTSEEELLSVKKEQLSNRVPLPGKNRVTVSRLSTCQTALYVGRQALLKRVLNACSETTKFCRKIVVTHNRQIQPVKTRTRRLYIHFKSF